MNKKKILGYSLLGIISFLILIYQTLPYSLIKENIVIQLQSVLNKEKIPLKVSIHSLKPYWITGIEMNDLEVSNKFNAKNSLVIDLITARVSFLSLLIGNFTINIHAKQKEGEFNSSITFPLFSILSGNVALKKADVKFNEFKLDNILDQILTSVKTLEKPEFALVLPIISKTSLGGKLNGEIDFQDKTFANVKLNLKDAYLNMANESLNIPKQLFSNANLDLNWNGKKINISKKTLHISGRAYRLRTSANPDILFFRISSTKSSSK